MTERRIAILVSLPGGADDMPAFRRMLKALLRQFGLRCLAIRAPEDTKTFSESETDD